MNNTDLKLAAREAGERFYDTGQPCKRGHLSKRYASTGQCVECQSGQSARQLNQHQLGFGMAYHKPPRLLLAAELAPDVASSLDDYMVVCAITFLEHKGVNVAALQSKLSESRITGKPINEVM